MARLFLLDFIPNILKSCKFNQMRDSQINPYLFLICFLIMGCITSCSITEQKEKNINIVKDDFMLGGIQVNEPSQEKWMSVLKDAQMNTVSITVYARHGYWNENHLYWDNDTDDNVIYEIQTAKKHGMKVVFIPRVMLDKYFEDNQFLWHGMILPETHDKIMNWFKEYQAFIVKWAKICEIHDVDVFAIGSELRSLSQTQPIKEIPALEQYYLSPIKRAEYIHDLMQYKDDIPREYLQVNGEKLTYEKLDTYLKKEMNAKKEWALGVTYDNNKESIQRINTRRQFLLRQWYYLIDDVRKSYSGKLTYAANFDNYEHIAFWDKLDYMGINAYFKLRTDPSPKSNSDKYAEIEKSWETIFQNIISFQKENHLAHPVLFTELGYIPKEDCTIMPWKGFGFSIVHTPIKKHLIVWKEQPDNFTERALAMKALREVNEKHHLLQGILYWKLTSFSSHLNIEPFAMYLNTELPDSMWMEMVGFLP